MFTSLRFFFKGIPKYVYIDLKRSPLNLTLGKCKFNLRSMSKTSKPCQVVYYSTRIDWTKVFKPFCGFSGSKDHDHKQTNVHYENGICNIWREIDDVIFWVVIFWSSAHCTRKVTTYLESWGNSEHEEYGFCVKILIWKVNPTLTWPWPDLHKKSDGMT